MNRLCLQIDIYGNKVAIITLRKEMAAMIIGPSDLADMQRMIFELARNGAKTIKNKRK